METVNATRPAEPGRFVALDSMRGLFACLVALYHLHTTSWLGNLPLVRGGWLFVDFFFLLSGFVIAAAYRRRLAQGFPVRDFMWLRLGRVYPLHLFMLLLLLGFELALSHLGGSATDRAAFEGAKSLDAFVGSVLLIHIFGIWPTLVWNGPSWSIAAEVWTYLFYALLARFAARLHGPLLVLAALGAGAAILATGDGGLDRTYDFSLVRCIFAFALGALTHGAYTWLARGNRMSPSRPLATLLEFAIGAAAIGFVCWLPSGPLTMVAPLLFLLCLLVFALERGWISTILSTAPFQLLGTLSYSIYMTHGFVESRMLDLFYFAGGFVGIGAVRIEGPRKVLALGGLGGEVATLAVLAAIIAFSYCTYRLVERPCRQWSRHQLTRRRQATAVPAERIAPTF